MLVVPGEDVAAVRAQDPGTWKFRKLSAIVPGGATRADSVREGLSAVPETCRYVAVHDAVRPLITARDDRKSDSSGAPVESGSGRLPQQRYGKIGQWRRLYPFHSVPGKVWLAQTPQVFERRLLNARIGGGKLRASTDDAHAGGAAGRQSEAGGMPRRTI